MAIRDRRGDRAAVARAAELATRIGRRLVLVNPVDPGRRRGTRRRLERLGRELPVECEVADLSPAGAALDWFATRRRADVLVVGARGRTPLLVVPPVPAPRSAR